MVTCKKFHLKYKIEPIVKVLNSILILEEGWKNEEIITKSLQIYKILDYLLDPYLSNLIPTFCDHIIMYFNKSQYDICKSIMELFITCSVTCK